MSNRATRLISIQTCLAGLLYFTLAASTIVLSSNGHEIATFWPANAVLVALMLQSPRTHWKYILTTGMLANIAANLLTRGSLLGPFLFGISNMVEVYIVAWGLHAAISSKGILHQPGSVGRLLLWAGLIGPTCSSILGAATAWLVFDQPFGIAMINWFLTDALGLLVFTPVFYTLFHGDFVRCFRGTTVRQRVETIALQGLVLLTAIGVFTTNDLPILFLVPIPIMLVTFRLGWLGTKISVMIVAIIVAIATAEGTGPIMLAEHLPHVFFSQFYLASLLLMQLPIAAALNSRSEVTEQLARSEKSVRMLAEQSELLLLSLDRSGTFTRVIGASGKLIGRQESDLLGRSFEALPPEVGERLSSGFREVMDYDCFDQALEFAAPGNPDCWREARYRVLEADRLANFEVVLTIQDITDHKRREGVLVEKAHVDGMTGLLNRAGFTDAAQRHIAQATEENLFLVMIDVDRFKLINDNLGHAAGDAVLAAIAQQMKNQLRATDIIGRLGGDEFAIVLRNVSRDQAHDACDRLVASIARSPVALPEGKDVGVNISCGVACWTAGDDLEQLKHRADMALYEAKRGGRNKAVAA
ncbi:MAG: diguanylate cyclase [Sphingobium sp.]